jgi:outer membrane protein assembly factor BamB
VAGGLSAAPAITELGLYAGGSDGRVYRLDLADGGEVWQVEVGAAVTADPVIVDDMLVLGLSNGDVVGLMARSR